MEKAETHAADQLLPLVYKELRKLAAQKLAKERPGQTLEATALVHEAYIRLVDQQGVVRWENKGHFFSAAAEAMRRILIERARRKQSKKRGGGLTPMSLAGLDLAAPGNSHGLLEIDIALEKLTKVDPQVAQFVKLRYYAGLTVKQAAEVLGIAPRTANQMWTYARAWLLHEVEESAGHKSQATPPKSTRHVRQ